MIFYFGLHGDRGRDNWPLYDILDVTRGLRLNDLPIAYLDSDVGYYRILLKDADGQYYYDPDHPDEAAAESRLCKMSVTPRTRAAG